MIDKDKLIKKIKEELKACEQKSNEWFLTAMDGAYYEGCIDVFNWLLDYIDKEEIKK